MKKHATEAAISQPKLTGWLIWLMALSCGMGVANLYYNQPLLANIGQTFQTSVQHVGIISMLTQIGYAVGLFFFVPLGDKMERRRVILLLLVGVIISLIAFATSENLLWINLASLAIGMTTVIPQLIVPLAAQLAEPTERGKVIGNVMSGMLIGILLARTISGYIGGIMGWRSMYWIAAILMLVLAIILRLNLPKSYPTSSISYGELLKSVGKLIVELPILQEASIIGSMIFGCFSLFWTVLSFFLSQSTYHFDSKVAGLFGLVGVVGACAAPIVGRLGDRLSKNVLVGISVGITFISFIVFWIFGLYLWGLILGVILLDLGAQSTHILNQSRIYSKAPEARSRLTMVYMVSNFIGGAIGSTLGGFAWSLWRWNGICAVGVLMSLIALMTWGFYRYQNKRDRISE